MYTENRSFSEMRQGVYTNVIGACGIRPIGFGKKHKERLDAWQKCQDQNRSQKATEKELKLQASQQENMLTSMLSGLSAAAPGAGPSSEKPGGGTEEPSWWDRSGKMVMIAIGGTAVIAGSVWAFIHFTKKGKTAA